MRNLMQASHRRNVWLPCMYWGSLPHRTGELLPQIACRVGVSHLWSCGQVVVQRVFCCTARNCSLVCRACMLSRRWPQRTSGSFKASRMSAAASLRRGLVAALHLLMNFSMRGMPFSGLQLLPGQCSCYATGQQRPALSCQHITERSMAFTTSGRRPRKHW